MSKNAEFLSEEDREIIRLRAEGKSLVKIGREVLPHSKNPSQAVYGRLQKPAVRARLLELLERAGLHDEKLVKSLKQLLNAKRTRVVQVEGSRIKRRIKEPDWDIIARALDMILKLRGLYAPERIELSSALDTQQAILAILQRIANSCPNCKQIIELEFQRLTGDFPFVETEGGEQ